MSRFLIYGHDSLGGTFPQQVHEMVYKTKVGGRYKTPNASPLQFATCLASMKSINIGQHFHTVCSHVLHDTHRKPPIVATVLTASTTLALAKPVDGVRRIIQRDTVLANQTLADWLADTALPLFFPNHTGWDTHYDRFFSPNLTASFGINSYNYTTLKAFFNATQNALAAQFEFYAVEVDTRVGLAAPDGVGGQVLLAGKEYGVLQGTGEEVVGTNGIYSVIEEVDGQRLITEVRPRCDAHKDRISS